MSFEPDPLHVPLSELKGAVHKTELKPSWRGWIHTGVLPLVVAAGILLIVFSDGWVAKTAAAIYFASSILLFGNSALYHRFNWRPSIKKTSQADRPRQHFLAYCGHLHAAERLGT